MNEQDEKILELYLKDSRRKKILLIIFIIILIVVGVAFYGFYTKHKQSSNNIDNYIQEENETNIINENITKEENVSNIENNKVESNVENQNKVEEQTEEIKSDTKEEKEQQETLEQRKGQTSLRTENPEYPNNFINAILNELEKDKIVVSPFIEHVFKAIDSDNFKNNVKNTRIILVFPMSNNFDEYVDRFKKRGNNEEFILRRKKEFSSLIDLFEKATTDNYEKIIIKPKQYLSEALIEYGVDLKER